MTEEEVKYLAINEQNVKKYINNQNIIKFIIIPKRIVNIIIK